MPVDSVNTIDDLRSYVGSADLLIVKGYWSIGDGGGGTFYLDKESSDKDDGGITIQSSAGLPGCANGMCMWKRIFDGYVNVRWFGAKGNTLYRLDGWMNAGSNILNSGGITVSDLSVVTQEGQAVSCTATATDSIAGAVISFMVVTDPKNGTLTPEPVPPGTFGQSYKPNPGFTGTDSFTYLATDNHSQKSNCGTFTITVITTSPPPPPPPPPPPQADPGQFTSADVGKAVGVYGAGSGGLPLLATITSYKSPSQVQLSSPADTTVSCAIVSYGTDDTNSIQNAIDYLQNHHSQLSATGVSDIGGQSIYSSYTLYVPGGRVGNPPGDFTAAKYKITQTLELPDFLTIKGDYGAMLQCDNPCITILRIGGESNIIEGIGFAGGLNHITFYGLAHHYTGYLGYPPAGSQVIIRDCVFRYPAGPCIYQDVSSPPGVPITPDYLSDYYRDSGSNLVVEDCDFEGACLFWGQFDQATFQNCYVTVDLSNPPFDDSGKPLAVWNSTGILNVEDVLGVPNSDKYYQSSAWFQGTGLIRFTRMRFGGESALTGIRVRTNSFPKYRGMSLSTSDPNVVQPCIYINESAMASYGGLTGLNWLEIYDVFPAVIDVRNPTPNWGGTAGSFIVWECTGTGPSVPTPPAWQANQVYNQGDTLQPGNGYTYTATNIGTSGDSQPTWPVPTVASYQQICPVPKIPPFTNSNPTVLDGSYDDMSIAFTLGVWVDADIPMSFIAAQNKTSILIHIEGFPMPDVGGGAFRFRQSSDPTSTEGEDLWPYLRQFLDTEPSPYANYLYSDSNMPQNNLYFAGVYDLDQHYPPSVFTGLAVGVDKDPSTGYPLTTYVRSTKGEGSFAIELGTSAFPKGWGDGLPSGEYVFSMYVMANWTGEVILGRGVGAQEHALQAARWFVKSDRYQRMWFTFYHDGKGKNFVLQIYHIPAVGTFSIGLFAIHKGTTPAPYTFPGGPLLKPNDYIPGIYYSNSSPTTGTYKQGDIVYNTNPTAGGYVGWICVSGGSPGMWKSFGPISP